MKSVVATVVAVTTSVAFAAGTAIGGRVPEGMLRAPADVVVKSGANVKRVTSATTVNLAAGMGARGVSTEALTGVVRSYCGSCHSADTTRRKGNLTLTDYVVDSAMADRRVSELMVRKLRADMMPPPGSRRPGGDSLIALVETIEQVIDRNTKVAAGVRTFQRMNRPEYAAAIRDLLGLEVDASLWLPLDQKSAGFDNIADVQGISPMLLESYLTAAGAVSRMAIGDRNATTQMVTYKLSPFTSQHPWEQIEGAPFGTRGGLVTTHTFPADGLYQIRIDVGGAVGGGTGTRLEDIDVSVDGTRLAKLGYERGLERSLSSADDFLGSDFIRTDYVPFTAGQHKLSAAFIRRFEGMYEDLVKPNLWSQASNGSAGAGTTEPAKIRTVTIIGPQKVTGVSDNAVRRRIFSCKPASPAQERPCAQSIVSRLGRLAYRRPLASRDVESLMSFYDKGSANGAGFEEGVRLALQAMLASPRFVFRIEAPPPSNTAAGEDYQISDYDLATRLSFFLWGSIPDEELLALADQGKLRDKKTLEKQAIRMLKDPRAATALTMRFGEQWLRIQDLEKVHPDAFFFPDFSEQTSNLMRRETQEFFKDLVSADKSMMELYSANYSFMNEQLARFYGIPGVAGQFFRKVQYPDDTRRGIFGQGSYLVQTSYGNRTSPVLRGKYVMEVLIGAPPPPPPPDVPDLEQAAASSNGKVLTTRERMELHRSNATCKACHQYIDPIGLATDNFDVTGRLRYRENLQPLDTRGVMYDGTPVSNAGELANALLKRPIPLARTFAENLMAYGIGRRVEDHDQPAVRVIAKQAEKDGYKFSSFVLGVVNSQAFRMRTAAAATATDVSR